ncbi:MAG: DUF3489 domain-containing protein [Erythrobacter sp.]|nr:DUF3489 domain-containing protein [Erythrobacter sp.]
MAGTIREREAGTKSAGKLFGDYPWKSIPTGLAGETEHWWSCARPRRASPGSGGIFPPRYRRTRMTRTKNAATSKLDQLETMILRKKGASIAEMMKATGWQSHSVRGALAGALKKRGLTITSDKADGVRRYRCEKAS